MIEAITPSRGVKALGTRSRSGCPSSKSKYISDLASITPGLESSPDLPFGDVQIDDAQRERDDPHVRKSAALEHAPELFRRRKPADRLGQVLVGASVARHQPANRRQ